LLPQSGKSAADDQDVLILRRRRNARFLIPTVASSNGFVGAIDPTNPFTIVIVADGNTLLPEFALVAKRQPLELSTSLQSSRFTRAGVPRVD
jgi:hypothetical protein